MPRRSGVTPGRLRKVGAEIGVSGIDEILANVAATLDRAQGKEAKQVFMGAAQIAVAEIKDMAPRGPTGRLKSAPFAAEGDPKKPNVLVGMNYKKAPHSHWVEYGTAKMRPQPYFRLGVTATRAPMAASLAQGMKRLIGGGAAAIPAPGSRSGPTFTVGVEFL